MVLYFARSFRKPMSVNLAKYHFTVSEYERMGETGIFAPDARLELIEGQIIEMSPTGSLHAACVKLLSRILNRMVGEFARNFHEWQASQLSSVGQDAPVRCPP